MFASSWPRVVAALSALVFSTLLGASLLAAPSASAVDLPIVGSPECEAEVARAATVIGANEALEEAERDAAAASDAAVDALEERDDAAAVLSGIGAGLPGFDDAAAAVVTTGQALDRALAEETNAQGRVAAAERVVADVERVATETLCTTEAVDETTRAPTPAPSTTVVLPPASDDAEALFARISGQIRGLSCDAYNRELGAINDVLFSFETSQTLGGKGFGALQDQLNARISTLNSCLGSVPVPTTSPAVVVELDPLADDGSVAATNGTQITIVPAGSASTGGV